MQTLKPQQGLKELEKRLNQADKRLEELIALNKLSQAISSTMDVDKILEIILSETTTQIDAFHSSIMLLQKNAPDAFTTLARQKKEIVASSLDKTCRTIAGWVLKSRTPLLVEDILADSRFKGLQTISDKLQSVLAYPMISKDNIIGVMVFQNLKEHSVFTEENQRIISIFASQSAQVLENAQLYQMLADSNIKLEEANRTLEQRVAERTEQLNQKKIQLEKTLKELRESQNQLVMKEKMASLGNLVAGIAHEINNPIGAINSAADVITRCNNKINDALRGSESTEKMNKNQKLQQILNLVAQNSKVIQESGQRISKIVKSLKNFARLDNAEFQQADIHEGIDNTLALLHHELKDMITIIKDYGKIPLIYCYPIQLNQVFMNVLLNAIQAIETEGIIKIKTFSDDGNVHIKISDTGKGIPHEHLNKIFDPGFTKKGVGVGTGLGLSTCYNIIQMHKGEIKVASEVGKGTTLTIILPLK